MFTPGEREEMRNFVHQEIADIEYRLRHQAGSYKYLCSVGGMTVFSHIPVGSILHVVR